MRGKVGSPCGGGVSFLILIFHLRGQGVVSEIGNQERTGRTCFLETEVSVKRKS